MTWIALDDRFGDNPKVAPLSDKAFRAYVEALCYCGGARTNGYIPKNVATRWVVSVNELIAAGLWERTDVGFHVHDYLKYQRTKAQIEADSAAKHERNVNGGRARSASAERDEHGRFSPA